MLIYIPLILFGAVVMWAILAYNSLVMLHRTPLEQEIDAESECVGLFCLLPEKIIRMTYPGQYFGTERYPDWKF